MTDLDALLRAALDEAVEPAPPFARIERRHRARRSHHLMTAAAAVLTVAAASALAGPRLDDVVPTGGDGLKPFAEFRTDAAAKAGFDRCKDRTAPGAAGFRDPDAIDRCFREQGYQPPSRDFREPGYTYYARGESVIIEESWPQACQPTPLADDPAAIVLAHGQEDGVPWTIVTYEGAGGTVCLTVMQSVSRRISTVTPRFAVADGPGEAEFALDDTGRPGELRLWAQLATGEYGVTPTDRDGTALFWGPVGPEVTRVRLTFAGKTHVVDTVASPLAPDRRFVAVGLRYRGNYVIHNAYLAVLYDAAGHQVGRINSRP